MTTRRDALRAIAGIGVGSVAGCLGTDSSQQWAPDAPLAAASVRQYSAPNCDCCEQYASYLREHVDGDVTETVPDDVDAIKRDHGVPDDLRSCHTVVADENVVEGHVPAVVIERLLDERPAIDGVALPGMPRGSPGMPGEPHGDLVVYAIGGGRTGDVFATV